MHVRSPLAWLLLLALLIFQTHAISARADIFDASSFSNLSSIQNGPLPTELVKTVGISTDIRPYRGATPLSDMGAGLDLGLDFVLVRTPADLGPALTSAGVDSGSSIPPALPIPRLSLQKGIGPVDLGVCFLGYSGYVTYGGWLQFPITAPDQGLRISGRLGYEYSKFSMVTANVISPSIIASREMDFFEPYLGFGWNYAWGKIVYPITVATVSVDIEATGTANGVYGLMGTVLRLGPTGLLIALEGSFHQLGMHSLGFKFGFRF